MKAFIALWIRHWVSFVGAAALGVAAFLAVYVFANRMEAEAQLISTTPYKTSSTQLPWENNFGGGSTENQVKDELKDLSLWLKSTDFMREFLAVHCGPANKETYCAEILDAGERAPLRLLGLVSAQVDDGKILRIKAGAPDAEQASALANALANDLVDQRRKLEQRETKQLQDVLLQQKTELEGRLHTNVQRVSRYVKGGSAPSLQYEARRPLGFLNDLQTKAADLDRQITENETMIRMLREQASQSADGPDYGPSLKIRTLRAQNALLTERRRTLGTQINRSLSAQYAANGKGDTGLNPLLEEYRADVENHAAIIKALSKTSMTLALTAQPVEFFQKASPLLAKNRWPLSLMVALGLFLSQLFAIGGFLLVKLWRESVGPEAARPARFGERLLVDANA